MKEKQKTRRLFHSVIFASLGMGFLLTFFICHAATARQNGLPVFINDSLESYIIRGMADWEIPGLALAMVKDGEVIMAKGYGYTKAGGTEPVDANTLFMIGSLTKAFTATTMAMLQEEGKLSLEDKVHQWIPGFSLKDQLAGKEMNILDLLSHRTGFASGQGDFIFANSILGRSEIIERLGRMEAQYGFRSKFGYSNEGYLVAGELISKVTGKSWEETVKEKILVPLQMDRTVMLTKEFGDLPNRASGFSLVDFSQGEMPVFNFDNLAPAGSMSSCASDMAKWLLAHLNKGKLNNVQVLPEKAFLEVRTPCTIVGMDTRSSQLTHFALYGLGLYVWDRKGEVVYWHSGFMPGFASQLVFIPEKNFGLVIMTNTDYNAFSMQLRNEIMDAVLDVPYKGYNDQALKFFNQYVDTEKAKTDSLQNLISQNLLTGLHLAEYAGTYENELYGPVEVKEEGTFLRIYFPLHPDVTARLEPMKSDVFFCTYSNPLYSGIFELSFDRVAEKVSGFTLPIPPQVEYGTYSFTRRE